MKKLNIPIVEFREKLNEVSPSFCIAKWKQVTLHLQTGQTHSCHHPSPHRIPIEELENNPSALHNTMKKKYQRKLMLEGQRPAECDYCWRIEDSGLDAISDRVYKSADAWALPHFDEVRNLPWDANIDPSYLEVSFSSVCNFKCSYCSPQISSKWMEEIEKFGGYPTSHNFNNIEWLKQTNAMPISHKDHNPYVEAFWKWFPDIFLKLEHFRITGGEPLLTKDTFKVLDYIIENPNPELHLSINSNMCPPDSLLDKFIEKIKIICAQNKVKQFKIFTSAEAHGKQAEYIRYGLDYNMWIKNIRRILDEVPNCTFTVMSTYNVMSIFSYKEFMQDILDIKREYGSHQSPHAPIILDVPYLRFPAHQAIFVAPKETLPLLYDQVTFMYANLQNADWYGTANRGFFQWEADKFRRVYELLDHMKADDPHLSANRADFIRFVDEHDKRRGTNFLETFPQMEEYYREWKKLT